MPNYNYPGVYMEEVSSGVRPIAAAGTSTAAFVGATQKGPVEKAVRITNWTQFQKYYGDFIDGYFLPQSVFQFFNNGGNQCYVLRTAKSDADIADVTVNNRAAEPGEEIRFIAKNTGAWGNNLYLQIEDGSGDGGNTFKVKVWYQEVMDISLEDFVKTPPLEIHDNLSMDPNSSQFVETVLENNSYLIDAKVSTVANPNYQNGFHKGGAGAVVPSDATSFLVNIDGLGFKEVNLPASMLDLNAVVGEINTAVQAMTGTDTTAYSGFVCSLDAEDRLVLTSGTNTATSSVTVKDASTNNATALLKLGETYGGVSENGRAIKRPGNANVIRVGNNVAEAPVAVAVKGSDGNPNVALTESDYSAQFKWLDNVTDFSLLAVPGIGTNTMMNEGMSYCAGRHLQDVFYIGEMSADEDFPAEAIIFRNSLNTPNSYGALYYPWVKAMDLSGKSKEPVLLPPSGYIAGLYARIDSTRGVWKAPAGTEAILNGALGLAYNLTDVEQGNLNKININCIRRFDGAGIVNWGARTITSDAEWNYVPVRRMAIMLRVSIYNNLQWAVFEPNDDELWEQIRLNLNSFMLTLFRRGAFQGSSTSQAFFVKCDGETTTQDDINLGIVNVLVGFAPLKPAEFVVVKISQKAGQTS